MKFTNLKSLKTLRRNFIHALMFLPLITAGSFAENIFLPNNITSQSYVFLAGSSDSSGKDWVMDGQTVLYTSDDSSIKVKPSYNDDFKTGIQIGLSRNSNTSDYMTLDFDAQADLNGNPNILRPGIYRGATRFPFNRPFPATNGASATPGLSLSGNGRGCNELKGEFIITKLEFSVTDPKQINTLEGSFVQYCDGSKYPVHGYVKISNNRTYAPACEDNTPLCKCIKKCEATEIRRKAREIAKQKRKAALEARKAARAAAANA